MDGARREGGRDAPVPAPLTASPRVRVIVADHDGESDLAPCVAALAAQRFAVFPWRGNHGHAPRAFAWSPLRCVQGLADSRRS
jgi:hypothetical protein